MLNILLGIFVFLALMNEAKDKNEMCEATIVGSIIFSLFIGIFPILGLIIAIVTLIADISTDSKDEESEE